MTCGERIQNCARLTFAIEMKMALVMCGRQTYWQASCDQQ